MPLLQEQNFQQRLTITNKINEMFVQVILQAGYFTNATRSTETEDINLGIDLWVSRDFQERWPISLVNEAASLKNRDRAGYRDIPVCRFQPFHGVDSEVTDVGRDYRALIIIRAVTQTLVVIKDEDDIFCEIYRISSEKLRPQIEALEREWIEAHASRYCIPQAEMTLVKKRELIQSRVWTKSLYESPTGQVWWNKNDIREAPKINFYLPESLKEDFITIPRNVGLAIKNVYDKLKQDADNARRRR